MRKIITLISVLLLITACTSPADHTPEEEAAQTQDSPAVSVSQAGAEEAHHGEEAMLTRDQIQKINLKLGPLQYKNLQATLKVNGQLELPPQNQATVSPLAGGVVNKIFVRQGQYVKKGGHLASLTNPEFISLQEEYLATKARLEYLEKEYKRLSSLVETEIAAKSEFDSVLAEKTASEAKVRSLAAQMKLFGLPLPQQGDAEFESSIILTSPIDGFVRMINTNTGAYIEPQSSVFEIVNNHHIHMELMVFEQDLQHIKVNQKIGFILQSNPKEVMEARVFAIGKALETQERAVRVHAEIENQKGHLLPGMYVEARIFLDDQTVASVPEEALSSDKGLQYIFVKEEELGDEVHFLKVQVLTGASDAGYVAITPLEELEPDAEIVLSGAFFLMAQTKKDEGGGGHHHYKKIKPQATLFEKLPYWAYRS